MKYEKTSLQKKVILIKWWFKIQMNKQI